MAKLTTVLVHAEAELAAHVEAKVKAAATAAGFATALIGALAFHGGTVPEIITAAVGALVTGGLTFAAGWLARHTPRLGGKPAVLVAAPATNLAAGDPVSSAVSDSMAAAVAAAAQLTESATRGVPVATATTGHLAVTPPAQPTAPAAAPPATPAP